MPVVDPARVAGWLMLPAGSDTSDANLAMACDLASALINSLPWVRAVWQATAAWPPAVTEAGVMLAARLYRRRNPPSGVESFGDMTATYVLRHDPDVARALRIGPNAMPAVG